MEGGRRPRPAVLAPVDVSFDRIIRTTVGLRPFRDAGFVVRAERLDGRMLIHNYGHGGAGMSLSWGTASANPLLPSSVALGRVILQPGEHPFASRYAIRRPTLRFEPAIYLDALMRDVIAFRGRIVVRSFDSPRDLVSLPESLIVNCTGLGSKLLFGDEELTPVKGQLVVLVPQPEVTYTTGGMMPRSDGIVLGHTMERGVWTLDVNETELKRVVERHMRTFSTMRVPARVALPASSGAPSPLPPVESFFDRES
jgi:hypothetical protein